MANFCTNCGTKIRQDDKFCTNCGSKIINNAKFCFCTNCGTKIRQDDKFCTNCGIKIWNKHSSKSAHDIIEEEMERIDKQNEDKNSLKNKVNNEREHMNGKEIRYSIKTELKKVNEEQEKARIAKEKETKSNKIEEKKMARGGYCNLSCIHCYEEFLDSGGEIAGDFTSDGTYEYYCNLGHSVYYGSFCEDYE